MDEDGERYPEFHMENLLEVNRRLSYVYGIFQAEKRDLRWISGARKQDATDEGKPEAGIAGVGEALVQALKQVCTTLKKKDVQWRKQGPPA